MKAFAKAVEDEQILAMKRLGEMCVENARMNGNYMDQTGNLRSSVGYAVFKDGTLISSTYDSVSVSAGTKTVTRRSKKTLKDGTVKEYIYTTQVKIGGDGAIGAKSGEALARRIGETTSGIALVCTAGMNYAIYVEASGRNVLTSAERLAEQQLPKMLAQLKKNIEDALS